MYLPAHFRQDDVGALHAAMRAFPLATLITTGPDGISASHVPMLLDPEPAPYGTLVCHLARANDQWRTAAAAEALVIFSGPQSYITPSWYQAKAETGRVVPTWNYVAVHARGHAHTFSDPQRLYELVSRLTDIAESPRPVPWAAGDAPERFMAEQLQGIVGLEIPIRLLTGKWKLSQNRPAGDRERIIAGLVESGDPEARATANVMASEPLPGPSPRG
jgi:transcriptional regulator